MPLYVLFTVPGEEIPIFAEADVTFFAHLMREIEADCPGFKKIQEFRNQIAHSPLTEIEDEDDVDDLFLVIEEAVNTLFGDRSLRQQRRKWREVLQQIRTDDIGKVEPQTKGFQEQVAKEKEATQKAERDIINANVINITSGNLPLLHYRPSPSW